MNGKCDGCGCDLEGDFSPSSTHEVDGQEWCHGKVEDDSYKTHGCYGREMNRRHEINRQAKITADRYHNFWLQQSRWSQETFGSDEVRKSKGPLLHLEKEVKEALEACTALGMSDLHHDQLLRNLQMELVDCFFLVTDAARRSGLTYEGFMDLVFKKLKINKARKWGKPTSDQPVEHDRSGE